MQKFKKTLITVANNELILSNYYGTHFNALSILIVFSCKGNIPKVHLQTNNSHHRNSKLNAFYYINSLKGKP
jgi:hypothetical protein